VKQESINSLKNIGLQLDSNQYPYVHNGGIVKPGGSIVVTSIPGEDTQNESDRQKRSATGSRQRSTRRQGSPKRSRPSGTTPQFVSPGLRTTYEAELDDLLDAYPETKIWYQAEGMWLLTESSVLPGLGKKATFLTAMPYSKLHIQKSWGFWTTPVCCQWIGPRHTNFPDGSICAFNPKDGTWKAGDSLVNLLDLYTLWALRHEHLNIYGRWPGRQAMPHTYERITESNSGELCGCDTKGLKYAECCQQHDLSHPLIECFSRFLRFTQGNIHRSPPKEICEFMKRRDSPPAISDHSIPIFPIF